MISHPDWIIWIEQKFRITNIRQIGDNLIVDAISEDGKKEFAAIYSHGGRYEINTMNLK